jgi:copper chaperone NosL
MFVAKYPEWAATLVFKDGAAEHFDGAKDLFKYLFDLAKYAPGRTRTDIGAVAVTEYYGLTRIDPHAAWFVIGSDVLGPMGHELVPLASRDDAEEFMRDHQGTEVLRFDDVTPELLNRLDTGSPTRR